MNNTSFKSYKLKIFQHTKYIKNTINIYQNLIYFLINIYAKEKELFKDLNSKEQLKLMERLIHKTDKNTPKYKEYNQNFPKLPSYFRRSGIMEVIGIFSSFDTRFNLYLEEKPLKTKQLEELKIKLSKKYDLKTENKIKDLEKSIYYEYNCPTFNFYPETFPVLYKNNMSEINKNDLLTNKKSKIKLKLFNGSDWRYFEFYFKDKNCEKVKKILLNNEYKLNNPKLIYKKENKHKIIQIHLTFEKKNSYQITKEELKLIKEKEYEGNINVCSIDLGIIEPITYNIKEIDFLKENSCTVDLKTEFLHKNKVFISNTTKFNKKLIKLRKVKSKKRLIENEIKRLEENLEFLNDKEQIKDLKNEIYFLMKLRRPLRKKYKTLNRQIRNYQKYFNNEIVNQFTKVLLENNINYLFMENLDNFIKSRNIKEKFHYWNKGKIFKLLQNRLSLLGIRYLRISPFNTSKTCSSCGNFDDKNRKTQSDFVCVKCNFSLNRDKNRSKNIFIKGFNSLQRKVKSK